jgi:hypothetical protein
VTYSAAIGALVGGLFWQTFRASLPEGVVLVIGGVLGIRVATLFASVTAAATLNWKAVWMGGGAGLLALVAWWAAPGRLPASPPPNLLAPILLSTVIVALTAESLPSRKGAHFYNTASFARMLHYLQGVLLFGMVLPASLVWTWPRPYAAAIIVSAFALWKLWDACPVTLAENEARAREGKPIMPPNSGFVPDVFARIGISVSGEAVGMWLYGIGLSLCGWFGIAWFLGT